MMLRDFEQLRAESKQMPQRYHIYISDRATEYQRDSIKSCSYRNTKFALRTQVNIHKVTTHPIGGVINNPWVCGLHGLSDFHSHSNHKVATIGQFLSGKNIVLDIAVAVAVVAPVAG